jgi:hypothetical protein
MRVVDLLARIVASLAGVSILSFAAGFFLAHVSAGPGWYYGTGLCIVGLGVLRMFAPTGDVSFGPIKRQRRKDAGHAATPAA